MKFSYITLLALPCLAVASVLPRAAAGYYDHRLCCAHVDYDEYDYGHPDHHHHHHHDHHDHHHHHDDGGVGRYCFPRYGNWCPIGEAVDCEHYDSYDDSARGCYSVDDDYGKAGKAAKTAKTEKTEKTVKAAKA
ncbi:hypothetical protein APHAL10511_000705 [Amanita phalloides]|nr:hypothetical protein APHAL10511_000705 [Amanita phalloides]